MSTSSTTCRRTASFNSPDGFLGVGRPHRCPLITSHEFAPAELEVIRGAPGYEALEGLEIVPSQTSASSLRRAAYGRAERR